MSRFLSAAAAVILVVDRGWAQGAWAGAGVLSQPRSAQTATLLHDGRVLVVGGYRVCGTTASCGFRVVGDCFGRSAPTDSCGNYPEFGSACYDTTFARGGAVPATARREVITTYLAAVDFSAMHPKCVSACGTHDLCSSGPPLGVQCNACVASVCAADSYCCTTSWDATCVAEVATYCGVTCP